jgi:hypothetical protein
MMDLRDQWLMMMMTMQDERRETRVESRLSKSSKSDMVKLKHIHEMCVRVLLR